MDCPPRRASPGIGPFRGGVPAETHTWTILAQLRMGYLPLLNSRHLPGLQAGRTNDRLFMRGLREANDVYDQGPLGLTGGSSGLTRVGRAHCR